MPGFGYLLQTSPDVAADDETWLTAAELETLGRLQFEKRRADWRLGRWTAKRAIAANLGLATEAAVLRRVEIVAAADGAPDSRLDGAPAPCVISLSHSAGRGLCATAPFGRLGCDLEQVAPRSAAFVETYLLESERSFVEQAPESARPRLVTLVWSAKESALKLLRVGLRADTRTVEVRIDPDLLPNGWARLEVRHLPDGERFAGWWRREDDLVLTVVRDPAGEPPAPV